MTIGIGVLTAGCGTARVPVTPNAVFLDSVHQSRPITVALHIDDTMAHYSTTVTTHPFDAGSGYDTIEVTYNLGYALTRTIENVVHRNFQEVRRTENQSCLPGTEALIEVKLAKPPDVSVRWVSEMGGEGGGAAVEFTVDVAVERCDERTVWHNVVQGYGSEEKPTAVLLWNNPAARQFEPAAATALGNLARNLDAALTQADLTALDIPQ